VANIDDLSNEIARELQRYANVIEEDMEVAKVGIVKVGEKRRMETQLLFIML